MKTIDLTGMKYGKLTVVSKEKSDASGRAMWKCLCECGNEITAESYNLRHNRYKSCGCDKKIGHHKSHGKSKSRLYRIWGGIKTRCYNPNIEAYVNYGGRGILMCEEWKNDFQSFYEWAIENGYSEELTIDRIDNNKNYEPSNCRWANMKAQNSNRRNTIKFVYNGEEKTLHELAEDHNISYKKLYKRVHNRKMSIEEALENEVEK